MRKQEGLGLATALFVITVMGVIAALVFQLVRNNAQTTEEELLLVRSFYAAESGAQFMLNSIFPPSGGAATCPGTDTTYTIEEEGLNACSAVVTCDDLVVSSTTYYTITSTGSCGTVSRTIQIRAQ